MKFASLAATALIFALPTFVQTIEYLTYDVTYDDASLLLNAFGCATDASDLITIRYPTLGSLPTFPNVGGVYTVTSWDSPDCGTCYQVTFGNTSIYVTAVAPSPDGFTLSEEAANTLTDGLIYELGKAIVSSTEVDTSFCGL